MLDCAPNNGQAIFDRINLLELSRSTPLYMAMENFTDSSYAPIFTRADIDTYLVVISDGMDSCGFVSGAQVGQGNQVGAEDLASITRTLLDDNDIMTFAIGFGADADPGQLNAIAENGGTPYTDYFVAGDSAELEKAFNEIAGFAIQCEFKIDPTTTGNVDKNKVNFYFDGELVPMDEGCGQAKGWDWTDATRSKVEFCKEACDQIKAGDVADISATFGCDSVIIGIV